jgi:hypothetical protein
MLVFLRENPPGAPVLWVMELDPQGPTVPVTARPKPLFTDDRLQGAPHVSPDGRFIAYTSGEGDGSSVYVSRFPSGDGRWDVSRGVGARPQWGATGDRLYFTDAVRAIVEMEVDLTHTFQPGPILARIPARVRGVDFDVAANGTQFLVAHAPDGSPRAGGLLVVQNWKGR